MASLCLISPTFLPFGRALLYEDLHLVMREDESLTGQWHEMSTEDDDAIEYRYQRFSTSFAELGRSLVEHEHLGSLVKSVTVQVDNSLHVLEPGPAARLLTSVLKACRTVDRITIRGSAGGQSPALLRAIVDADSHPSSFAFHGGFCWPIGEDRPCGDCLDGISRFLRSRTSALQDLAFVHPSFLAAVKVLAWATWPSPPLRLRRLTINPLLHDLDWLLAAFTSPSSLQDLTITLHLLRIPSFPLPSLDDFPNLTSLTLINPSVTTPRDEFLATLTQLLSTHASSSLERLILQGYTHHNPYAPRKALYAPTAELDSVLALLPRSLTHFDATLFPLSPPHVLTVLETCTSLRWMGYVVPQGGGEDMGGWSSAMEEEVRTKCVQRGMRVWAVRRSATEWDEISKKWRQRPV